MKPIGRISSRKYWSATAPNCPTCPKMAVLVKPAKFPGASHRRSAVAPYVSVKPKPFDLDSARHDRAIVCPWLPTNEVWDELRWSLRSIHRFFTDKECPIYVVSNVAPPWLKTGERVRHVQIAGYAEALTFGVQVAHEVCWTNDDIYFIRPTGWDDMRVALTEGTLDESMPDLRASNNSWRRMLGDACAELQQRGHKPVWRFSTHTPYLYERGNAIDVLRTYFITRKSPFETLYHNHHRTEHEDCAPHKARELPAKNGERYLNNRGGGPSPATQDELRRLLSTKPPWEK